MYKKIVPYEDFDGNQRTEEFNFNLTPAETYELQTSLNGGLATLLEKIVAEQDHAQLIKYFKQIVLASYGVKSLDGREFVKNDEVRQKFVATEAYSEIFMQLACDTDEAVRFINGILPSKERMEKYRKMIEASAKKEEETAPVVAGPGNTENK